jgi:hypothetical protein
MHAIGLAAFKIFSGTVLETATLSRLDAHLARRV